MDLDRDSGGDGKRLGSNKSTEEESSDEIEG